MAASFIGSGGGCVIVVLADLLVGCDCVLTSLLRRGESLSEEREKETKSKEKKVCKRR